MRKHSSFIPVWVALLMMHLVSCAEPRQASMANLRLTSDSEGNVPTLVYSPADTVYTFCDLTNATSRARVEIKIRALAAEGYLPDEIIVESGYGVFSDQYFTGPYGVSWSYGPAWPVGLYEADYFLNGTFIGGVPFSVR